MRNNLPYRIRAKVVYKNLSQHSISYTTYRDFDYFTCKYVDKKKARVVADTYRRNLEYNLAVETLTEADYMINDQVEIGSESYNIIGIDTETDDSNPHTLRPHKVYTLYLQK